MLRGRESLTRMVGKRRRLDAVAKAGRLEVGTVGETGQCQNNEKIGSEKFTLSSVRIEEENSRYNGIGKENIPVEWVKCPVCGKGIQGQNSSINSHLDFCLLGEVKLKNNQLTLSHFGLVHSRRSTTERSEVISLENINQHQSCEAKNDESRSVYLHSALSSKTMAAVGSTESLIQGAQLEGIANVFVSDVGRNSSIEEPFLKTQNTRQDGLLNEMTREDFIQSTKAGFCRDEICYCSCHMAAKKSGMMSEDKDREIGEMIIGGPGGENFKDSNFDSPSGGKDEFVGVLATCIVGRKFNQGARVEKGLKIAVLREPDNPKDSNAVKIIPADNKGAVLLGHLPRELACHLSCLLDKGILHVQGFVEIVPKKSYEAVPVKLICKRRSLVGDDEEELFNKSWEKILHVVGNSERQLLEATTTLCRYQQNFIYLLDTVLERDSHLFSGEEKNFLESFSCLSGDAQRLFIRLYQRKGPWFRVSHISYSDISNVKLASEELIVAGYLNAGDDHEREECLERVIKEKLEMLNVLELKQLICRGQWKKKIEGTAKKDELLGWIISAVGEKQQDCVFGNCSGSAMISLIMETIGTCVRVSDLATLLLWRLQRLFFLNGEQDLSAFLLVDMGRIKYPVYTCKRTINVFETRDSLLAYEQALEVAQLMDMALEANDKQSALQLVDKACLQLMIKDRKLDPDNDFDHGDAFLDRFSARWVYTTVVTLGVSVLERDHRYNEAVELLKLLLSQCCCPGKRGYWTVRLCMDLEHLGQKEESLQVAEVGLQDLRIRNGDRVALQRRVLRLGKPPRRWRKPPYADAMGKQIKEVCIRGRPLNCIMGMRSRFYGYDGNQCNVEELALQFYAGEEGGEWQGVHSEGGIWMTLFGLLMWDVLFADVPNVFLTPFQTSPLDLNTDAFYPAREGAIEQQLNRIYNEEAAQLLAVVWSKWYGTLCKGVNWERHSLTELQVIASCIGGPGLAAVCRLLSEDHAGWTSGMPDLLLWRVISNPHGTSSICSSCHCCGADLIPTNNESEKKLMKGESKLVEVKGPRDRLSEKQRAWILILMDAGLSVEVCKVIDQPKTNSNILS